MAEPWLLGIVFAVSMVLVLVIYVLFELEGYLFVKCPQLGRSIFAVNAAHAAYLVKQDAQGSLILAGLLQLVQKNEVDLNKTTFYWNYPEREIFLILILRKYFYFSGYLTIQPKHKNIL